MLIITSIDRLGRNDDMIINEWYDLTKKIECDIFVIDFPLLDTRIENENLVGRFISDIVLQVLSFVAQNERENIRKRQAEGIRIAKAKGIHMGRPKIKLPDNFKDIVDKYHNKQICQEQHFLNIPNFISKLKTQHLVGFVLFITNIDVSC